jgi:DNA (cytosine-5)-methyltransferase 1
VLTENAVAPDVLVGGTPCQAFSVAGMREGLNDPRGQLTIKFVELADAIDHVRVARGDDPAVIVWENVPGVLSDKGNAFGCFLGALAGEDCELQPAGGRWSNAGCVFGPARAIAWRVLDAQFFGVAQRRRRVFVVASARAGFNPAQVLFEFGGLRRDTAPSREAGENSASTAGASFKVGSHWDGNGYAHPTLSQSHNTGGIGASNQELFSQRGAGLVPTSCGADDNQGQAGHLICMAHGQDGAEIASDRTPTLTCNHEAPIIALQDTSGRDKAQNGKGWNDDGASYTLDAAATQGVAYAFQPRIARNGRGDMGELVNALTAQAGETGKGDAAPCVAVCVTGEVTHTLKADGFDGSEDGTGRGQPIVAFQPGNLKRGCGSAPNSDVFPTLAASHGRGASDQDPHVLQDMAVRRLTPRECERLQGFPDDWTLVEWYECCGSRFHVSLGKHGCPNCEGDKEARIKTAADGPRYKALGNSMAVPCMAWIGSRIKMVLEWRAAA